MTNIKKNPKTDYPSPLCRRDFLKLGLSAGAGALTLLGGSYLLTLVWTDQDSLVRGADLRLTGRDFQKGVNQDTAIRTSGLSIQSNTTIGTHLSPILETPIAFNAIVPQWQADLPPGTGMRLRLRTANASGVWSDWFPIIENDDWTRPDDPDTVGNMVTVSAEDRTHIKIQISVQLETADTAVRPLLRELNLTCIDATDGPTSSELITSQQAIVPSSYAVTNNVPKPFVISRETWCTSGDCNYTKGLEYAPVTHLIVHHTASSNTSSDWAATVRAIWYFHTYTRGWGDIGYQYLVDMDGVLYEGHLGGDDVVGVHAAGANEGSMAVALIGTFTEPDYPSLPGIEPPLAMLSAAADLLAWKAAEIGIDVYGAGYLPNVSWGLPFMMGHRDVYGTTSCPGEQAFNLLPGLRDEVARRIGLQSDYIYVDDLSAAFFKSSANWYDGPNGAGFNGHSYYTYSTTDPAEAVNWGEWQFSIPQDGWYEVAVYAPFANTSKGDTWGARYEVTHDGGVTPFVVNQEANLGIWVTLGTFYFLAATGGKVQLTDLTTTDDGRGLWLDAVRLKPLFPLPAITLANVQPGTGQWLNQTAVNFSWEFTNPALIAQLTLEAAADAAFTNLIFKQALASGQTSLVYDFGQAYPALYWRLIVKTIQNRFIVAGPFQFGIDVTPPTSFVTAVYRDSRTGQYRLQLSGHDAVSQVASFNIDYQVAGDSTWVNWLTGVIGPLVDITLPDPTKEVWFRSQAVDAAGNVETPHENADISTATTIVLDNFAMLPVIQR